MKKITLASLASMAFSGALGAQERPNIIVFLVDDMGLMDTSVPFLPDKDGNVAERPLNRWYRTPNMERLARQGVRFTTFYAQSVSSPSRTSIMTGQSSARHRTTNWIKPFANNRDDYGPYHWNWDGLTPDDCIYPSVLKEAGYRTIHVGKAHLGRMDSVGEDPVNLGYDINIAGNSIGHPGSYYGENGYGWIRGQRKNAVPGLEKYHGTPTFLTDALTVEAVEQIEKSVQEGRPFYLNMAQYAVHHPFEANPDFLDNYASGESVVPGTPKLTGSEPSRAFATLIESMDKSLGDLMDKLEEMGIAEDTFIIFLGDNGGDAPLGDAGEYGSSAPLRGKKGDCYEGGTRVPFIAAWARPDAGNKFQKEYPAAVNFVQNQMGTVMDIYPTVLSVAGVELPQNHVIDGSDLKKLISGHADRTHRDDFISHFPHEHRSSYFTAYRKGDWKLIYHYNPETDGIPTCELYNLADDPFETYDLSGKKPRKVTEMCRLMIGRLKSENALYPVDKEGRTLYPEVL